jgi:hypothetical protein
VHWDLAPVYAEVRGVIGEGALFRAEAVVAYPWLSGKIDCDHLTAEFDIHE